MVVWARQVLRRDLAGKAKRTDWGVYEFWALWQSVSAKGPSADFHPFMYFISKSAKSDLNLLMKPQGIKQVDSRWLKIPEPIWLLNKRTKLENIEENLRLCKFIIK